MQGFRLILASASPRRSELLRSLKIPFEVVTSKVEEIEDDSLPPAELALENARRKSEVISSRFPRAIVLGADTVVTLDGRHFAKPRDLADAERMLLALQGKTHQVMTGVVLSHTDSGRMQQFVESTEVRFKSLSLEDVQSYISKVDVLDKAGAYAIQEHGKEIIAEISGSFSNVVGLPLEKLTETLKMWGVL